MKLDLPEPVAPATRRCGILAMLATTKPPSTSLPSATVSGWWSFFAFGRAQHVAERDHLLVQVGDLDADGGLAGDGGEDPDLVGCHRVGDVVGQAGDLAHLDGRAELHLVAGDGGAARVAGDARVDLELAQHVRRAGAPPCPRPPCGDFGLEPVSQRPVVGEQCRRCRRSSCSCSALRRRRACAAGDRARGAPRSLGRPGAGRDLGFGGRGDSALRRRCRRRPPRSGSSRGSSISGVS